MAEKIEKLTVEIGAKNNASGTLDRVGQDLEKLAERARRANEAAASRLRESVSTPHERLAESLQEADRLFGAGFISGDVYKRAITQSRKAFDEANPSGFWGNFGAINDKLKERFGPKGPLKDLIELAVGGGAIAGIDFLTDTVHQTTSRAVDLRDRLKDGKLAAADLPAELVKTLPILKGIAGATEDVVDLFTGWRHEIAKINSEVEKADQRMADRARRGDILKDANAAGNKAALARSLSGLPPDVLARVQATIGADDAQLDRIMQLLQGTGYLTPGHVDLSLQTAIAGKASLGPAPTVPKLITYGASPFGASDNSAEVIAAREALAKYNEKDRELTDRIAYLQNLQSQLKQLTSASANELPFPFRVNGDTRLLESNFGKGPLGLSDVFRYGLATPNRGSGDILSAYIDAAGGKRDRANSLAQAALQDELSRLQAARSNAFVAGVDDRRFASGVNSVGGRGGPSDRERQLDDMMKELVKQARKNEQVRDQDLVPFIKQLPQLVQQVIQAYQNPPSVLKK